MKIIVEEKNISDQVIHFFQLETLGIEFETLNVNIKEKDIIAEFQSNIVFRDNW